MAQLGLSCTHPHEVKQGHFQSWGSRNYLTCHMDSEAEALLNVQIKTFKKQLLKFTV